MNRTNINAELKQIGLKCSLILSFSFFFLCFLFVCCFEVSLEELHLGPKSSEYIPHTYEILQKIMAKTTQYALKAITHMNPRTEVPTLYLPLTARLQSTCNCQFISSLTPEHPCWPKHLLSQRIQEATRWRGKIERRGERSIFLSPKILYWKKVQFLQGTWLLKKQKKRKSVGQKR